MSIEYISHGTQCLEKVKDHILTLQLRRMDRDEVQVRDSPWTQTEIYRGCTIWNVGKKYAPGTNEREDVGYGCGVTFAAMDSGDPLANIDQLPYWEDVTRRHFNFIKRFDINFLKGCDNCVVTVADANFKPPRGHAQAEQFKFSSLVVRCWIREESGRGY